MPLFAWLTVAICLGIFFFGFRPKDLRWRNNVEWIGGDMGIRFGKYGIAYTEPTFKPLSDELEHSPGVTIEIALRSATSAPDRFKVILMLHNGVDATQMVVGQWRSHLVVLNGDDYDGRMGWNWNSVTEVGINTPMVASVRASADDGNVPANTLDGDLRTRWSANGDGQWIEYDLGSVQTVAGMSIAWFKGDQRAALFDLVVSGDGLSWTTVYSGQSSGTTLQPETVSFSPVQARYVRYIGHGNSANTWIGARKAFPVQCERFIAITSGSAGTKIYLDGKLAAANEKLILSMPNGNAPARLVVGNSVYGNHSWAGDIYGLALYAKERSSQEVEQAYQHWSNQHRFFSMPPEGLVALYRFDKRTGQRVWDQAGGHHLEIPLRKTVLQRKLLTPFWKERPWGHKFLFDVFINIIGFIPFGFCLNVWLRSAWKHHKRSCLILVILICLSISLLIEVVQSWMPSRSSQMRDLILNTSGAWVGALLYNFTNPQSYDHRTTSS